MAIKFVLNETSYFGKDARGALAEEITKRKFKKVFLVSDKSLVNAGVTAKVEEIFKNANIDYTLYDEIKPNPTIKNVTDGVEACKASGADVIVTVGGGSSMDTAKGISIVMTNPDRADIKSLNGASNTINRGMPVIALPTTAGTASEVTINYVITDEDRKIKMVCVDPNDIPIVAIIDSDLMASMPKTLAAATGMDALTHAVEGYITKAHNEISDMFHMQAIKMIFKYLPAAVNDKDEKIQTISLNTTINNKTLVNSKIAPGTQGNFQIKLDGTDSEVGINYNIRFENETNKPRNLKFQYNGETYNSLNELQKILEGNIEANEENKIKTLDIKWIWPYETGTTVEEIAKNDKIDTEDSKNIKTYDFDVIVTGIQINPGE